MIFLVIIFIPTYNETYLNISNKNFLQDYYFYLHFVILYLPCSSI